MTLDEKLNTVFPGRVVRKDLTKLIKEGQNVPIYVLEYLLGMYCATSEEGLIQEGMERVKNILSSNYVRPDEGEKIKSKIRETGRYTVIDHVGVKLNEKRDVYEASFSNLGIRNVTVEPDYVKQYEKLLCGGIWCILQMEYAVDEHGKESPFKIMSLKPIQMPNMDMEEIFQGRKEFTKDEWIDVLIRSTGMEPARFDKNLKWHLLARLIPMVENNYNVCELGPRGTGKSHVYKELSPNSILISGGQTTVANLFYNMSTRSVGLVGLWDVVAFDEVAGIKFKDKDGIQIMKDFMASGSFARGKEEKNANASMVFVGNINQSVEVLLKVSHLFDPFPEGMNQDTAFFDRMHHYIPGWEIPKMRPEFFTDSYGFIVDYAAEFFREMRKRSFTDAIYKYFRPGNNLNQRDTIGVKKTFSGLMKLIYPDGVYTKEDAAEVLEYALTGRRRVKEQLKKMGGMEFYDVNFSYIDNESQEEHFVSVPEMGGGKLIPEGIGKPGQIYTVATGDAGRKGVFKMELQVVKGSGKYSKTGLGSVSGAKEGIEIAFQYFRANAKKISGQISTKEMDYHLNVQDLQGVGMSEDLTLTAVVALCSGAMNIPVQESLVILGTMTIGGTIKKVSNLADTLQVCLDAGAKRVIMPASSAGDISTVPAELFSKFQINFYSDPEDAVRKSLGKI
ncbi:MAG TPA: protease Lon-related BREX system protein BrxL [Candidatus Eremiobacteraeota bacterium]|nr:protease Lon-related BREX system protein BrxL [Candidatus Eremiobacteraeota bacterium]